MLRPGIVGCEGLLAIVIRLPPCMNIEYPPPTHPPTHPLTLLTPTSTFARRPHHQHRRISPLARNQLQLGELFGSDGLQPAVCLPSQLLQSSHDPAPRPGRRLGILGKPLRARDVDGLHAFRAGGAADWLERVGSGLGAGGEERSQREISCAEHSAVGDFALPE